MDDQTSNYARSIHHGRRRRRRKAKYTGAESVRSFASLSNSVAAVTENKLFELNKWQSLCKGLWFQLIIETNPSANKVSLNGFLDAINWTRTGEISKKEFNGLYSAWVKEGESHTRLEYYNITEDKVLISFSSFREIMIKRKYSTKDLSAISGLLLDQANARELAKGYYSRAWLMLLDSFFFTLDVFRSGILTVDDVLLLCLVQNPGRYDVFNDKKQQIEYGLSRFTDKGVNNFEFNVDLTRESLLRLSTDCYEVLSEMGAREGPLATPYKGLVTLHVFKQQIKRMSVKNSMKHPYSERRVQKLMANVYTLRASLSASSTCRYNKADPINVWLESIMRNTVNNSEDSIKLSMFLCHEGSCLRWSLFDREETWRSKKQIHSIWIAFKEQRQIFDPHVSSTLFLQLENTINSYVSAVIRSFLQRKRSQLPDNRDTLRRQAIPSSVRTFGRPSRVDDDVFSVSKHSTRSNNTYNNFNLNLVQDLQKLHYDPHKQPSLPSLAENINQLSEAYISKTRKVVNSSFAKTYNDTSRKKESLILSGKYFDVFNQLANRKQHVSNDSLDFREVKVDEVVHDIVESNRNSEDVVNAKSLINGDPTAQDEAYIDQVNEAYSHLMQTDGENNELVIHSDSIYAKSKDIWMKTNIALVVRKEGEAQLFFLCIYDGELNCSTPKEVISLVEAQVRPVLLSKYDESKNIGFRLEVSNPDVKYEFGSVLSKQQAYWIRLLSFAISTSRTTKLLVSAKYQDEVRSERDKQFDDFSIFQGAGTEIDNQSTFEEANDRSGFYEEAKSVFSGRQSIRAPSRPAPIATPGGETGLNRSESSFAATLDSLGSLSSQVNTGAVGSSALDRLTQATEQLRKALDCE